MQLSGLHLLLTYQCNMECDHCFVWGSPWQEGTMTLQQIHQILAQAERVGGIEWIYFEGGEPFLYHPILVEGVRAAAEREFQVGVVTNGYWATSLEDALVWLQPLQGLVQDLSVSSDRYHGSEKQSDRASLAQQAAERLDIPLGIISIAQPEQAGVEGATGQLPLGESAVMYRGRAVEKLIPGSELHPWDSFHECPHENLEEPGRVHVDPLGYVHICQGISLGNLFQMSLQEICDRYHPEGHPIAGPIHAGGPRQLVQRYGLEHQVAYADACHLCFAARVALRAEFPQHLLPDQMYSVPGA